MHRSVPIFINLERIIISIGTIYLLQVAGRKIILITGSIILVLCLLVMAIGFRANQIEEGSGNIAIIISIAVYFATFVNSYGPIAWLYMA